MSQPEKNLIFPHGVTGQVDIVFRVHRDRDDYLLDNDDGIFRETPVDADIPAVEDPDNDGVYLHNEDRVDWEFRNDQYTVFAYQAGTLIGEGKLKLHYGRGSVTLEPIGGTGGAAPLPAGASTSANQDVVITALGGSPNYYTSDVLIDDGAGPYTGDVAFGFTSRSVFIYNTEAATDLEYTLDGGSSWTTLEAGADITLGVAKTALQLRSTVSGHTYKLIAT